MVVHVNLGGLLLILCVACNVGWVALRMFKHAQAESWTGIKSAVLTMICFLMLILGIVMFSVSASQQEHELDAWLIPVFFTWPLLISYPLAIFRLLPKPIEGQWTRQESLGFRQHRQKGLRLAAISAA